MSINRRFLQRMPQPKGAWAVVLTMPVGLTLLWLLSIVWDVAEPCIGRNFPDWAWQHGTPKMQQYAAPVLATRIKPGMTFQQVLDILGPGSRDWPAVQQRKLQPEDTVSVNIRSDYNNGIDIGFQDGRVTSTCYYD
jgi:hypothetical protein